MARGGRTAGHAARPDGFGSRLIERGLAHELDGEVELDFDRAGVRCRVTVPLSERVRAAS